MEENKTKESKQQYTLAVGRHRESVAIVRLHKNQTSWDDIALNKGEILVNKKKAEEYFGKRALPLYTEPLRMTNTQDKFAITVKAVGGGNKGQLLATVLGIARALDKLDREKFRKILKGKGLLTRDSRTRERRKVGMGGKSRRRKQSPKR